MIPHTYAVRVVSAAIFASVVNCGAAALAADTAASLYSQRCASCHGDKGHGDGVAAKYLKPPPADFATSLKGKTDDWIAKAIRGGGAAVGQSPTMPPYPDLSDAQVKSLVDYIKHLTP